MNRFATHIRMLENILKYKSINSVIEFGMGDNSTSFFIDKVDNLMSVEMQSLDWYNQIYEKYKERKNWTPILSLGANEIFKLEYKKADLIFVDGHHETRAECVNFMSKFSDIIVAHDTEAKTVYKWDNVNLSDYYEFCDRESEPWTTIWTKDKELITFLKQNIPEIEYYKCYLNGVCLN